MTKPLTADAGSQLLRQKNATQNTFHHNSFKLFFLQPSHTQNNWNYEFFRSSWCDFVTELLSKLTIHLTGLFYTQYDEKNKTIYKISGTLGFGGSKKDFLKAL